MTPSMSTDPAYGFGLHLDHPFDEAMTRTRAALKEQGFGVLTEIDVQVLYEDGDGTTATARR